MKLLTKLSFIFGVCFGSSALTAGVVNIQYGSAIDGSTNATLGLYDSAESAYSSTNQALVAIGYFSTLPAEFSASASTFADFNVLASSTNFALPSYFNETESGVTIPAAAVGKATYIAVFKGISDYAQIGSAQEFGLFTDSSFAALPSGSEPPSAPEPYFAETLSFDSVIIGSSLGTGYGVFANGEGYATIAAIPEPSTYALIFSVLALGFVVRRRVRRS